MLSILESSISKPTENGVKQANDSVLITKTININPPS